MRILINILALKIGWLSCVLGAAYGRQFLGPAVVLALLGLHLTLAQDRPREVRLILLSDAL